MIINAHELDTFQSCPARWKLRDQYPIESLYQSDYIKAISKTIYYMYSYSMSTGNPISSKSARNFWDQQWWVPGMNKEEKNQELLFKQAADGWLLLQKFHSEFYKKLQYLPIGTNFKLSMNSNKLEFRLPIDLILVNNKGQIEYIELGKKRSSWQIYTSIKTKFEVCALNESLDKAPVKKLYIDLTSSKTSYTVKTLNIDSAYIDNAIRTTSLVKNIIISDTIIPAWSSNCKKCICAGKCWF